MKKKRQSQPVSVLDLAAYILANYPQYLPMPAWKMHKLAYYCQVCSLVREGPLFYEKIFATPKGVVIKELCPQHYNQIYIGGSSIGNLNHLSLKQVDTIEYVMKTYGSKTVEELDALINEDPPCKKAMEAIKSGKKEACEIVLEENT